METMKTIAGLVILSLGILGIYLLGEGVSGMMVAESCCFPPNCPETQLCDASEPFLENPSASGKGVVALGVFMVAGSIILMKLHGN